MKNKNTKKELVGLLDKALKKAKKYPEFAPLVPDIEQFKSKVLSEDNLSFKDGVTMAMYIRVLQ